MPIRIGTSGFLYDHWRGRLYDPSDRGQEPRHTPAHSTPSSSTSPSIGCLRRDVSVLARRASHRLRVCGQGQPLPHPCPPTPRSAGAVELLLERAVELGAHLGPILLQLPPDLPVDLDALDTTLTAFPPSVQVAVEPRHPSWFTPALKALLEQQAAAVCLADRRGPLTPQWRTTSWTYLRFHGGRATPRSCYSGRALDAWVERLAQAEVGPDGFAYFNNDHHGCALRDAAAFSDRLHRAGIAASRVG